MKFIDVLLANGYRAYHISNKNTPAKNPYHYTSAQPIDYDKGPYLDYFSEAQHKYGPYKEIIDYYKKIGKKANY